jgi:N-acetylneuraminic acid mutarotase
LVLMKRKALALMIVLALFSMVAGAEVSSSLNDSWTTLSPMPTARRQFGVAVVNGKIFAIGGSDWNYRYLATNEMFDPETNTWVKRTQMPTPRIGFGIAVYKNKIYVIGGAVGVDPSGNGNALITTANEAYDPATDTWETKAPLPTPRHGLTASAANGKIYTISGIEHNDNSYRGLNYGSVKNEVYDPETNTWTTKPAIPNGVLHAVSAAVGDKIYVLGGAEVSIAIIGPSSFNQVYDTKQETWTLASPVPVGFEAAAGVAFGGFTSKRICVFGGLNFLYEPCNLTQIYNPDKNVWVTGAQMPTPHAQFGVANVNDELYAIGGISVHANSRLISDANEKYLTTKITEDILVLSPQNKTYEGSSLQLDFKIEKPTSWMGYSLNGQDNVTLLGNSTISNLLPGVHNIRVYANDTAGNIVSSETIYFNVEAPESFPVVPTIAAAVIVATGLLVYFKKRNH